MTKRPAISNETFDPCATPRFCRVSSDDSPAPPDSFFGSRGTILAIIAIPLTVIALVYSVVFTGATSRVHPTGSVNGVVNLVSEELRLQGVDPLVIKIDVSLSSADNHWAMFILTPRASAPKNLERTYGFTVFRANRWQVIATGTSAVGCSTTAHAGPVPAKVLANFGSFCPPS